MFKYRPLTSTNGLVKFSKSEFVKEMINYGKFRISPASEYSKGNYIKSIKDLETQRDYKISALMEFIDDGENLEMLGMNMKIQNGFIPTSFMLDDYYLFSTCTEVDRRMPTDFEADAALIIHNKKEFTNRLKESMTLKEPHWEFKESEVNYYDPYKDLPKNDDQEFQKHFAFQYQKEHRCIIRSRESHSRNLKPFFIELGNISDISEALYIN
jgi:hypothetical protein